MAEPVGDAVATIQRLSGDQLSDQAEAPGRQDAKEEKKISRKDAKYAKLRKLSELCVFA